MFTFPFIAVPGTFTFSSHTHITSIDSRKPSTINYVKNVCKENGKTGTRSIYVLQIKRDTYTHIHSGDDTLD